MALMDEYEELVCEHCQKREVLKSNTGMRTPEWMTVTVKAKPPEPWAISTAPLFSLTHRDTKLLCATCFTDWRDGKTKKGA